MIEQINLGIALAADISKHLITLSTLFLAMTFAFAQTTGKSLPRARRRFLTGAWCSYLFTIVIALFHLITMARSLLIDPRSNYLRDAYVLPQVQSVTFLLGFVLFAFGTSSVFSEHD